MNGDARTWPDDGVILYDGVCILCSGSIRFVARRDVERRFRFTAIQSHYGQAMARALGIDPNDADTTAVVLSGKIFRRSDAALAILGALPRWRWVAVLRLVPSPVRDAIYTLIARNRYRVFGRHKTCDLRPAALEGRIITDLD